METKKILMTTSFYPPYHVGGACTHVYYLANELAKKGHEIHVLYSKDAYYLKRKQKPSSNRYINHDNVHLHELKTPIGKLSPLYSYVFGVIPFKKDVLKLFNQKYDLIHHHNISLLGPKILQYGKAKRIYTAHDHWFVCPFNDFFTNGELCKQKVTPINCSFCLMKNKRPAQLWRYSNLLKKSLKEIELIISPSNYLKNFLINHSIENPILVLPNFIPAPPKKIEALKEKNYFFYAGMLEEIKGIHNLLKAFKDTNKKLIIAGKGSLERYVKSFIKKNKLRNKIIYVDFLTGKEIFSYYKNASAFILPSIYPENCPNTILESLSVGTPTICSDTGGTPEIIAKVDKKLIFNYNNVSNLKEKIINFNKKEYDSKKIKSIYQRYFSTSIYIKNYTKVINKL